LNDICDVLNGFEEATNFLSGEKYPTVSMVLPVFQSLKCHLTTSDEEDSEFKVHLSSMFLKSLNYYISRFGLNESNPDYLAATFLDPRFKKFRRFNDINKLNTAAKKTIKGYYLIKLKALVYIYS
jgi:hypothetical protein